MARAFRRHGDRIRMQLRDEEVALLRDLHAGIRAIVEDADPDDPAIARLFPATVRGDDQADAELRHLIHDELLAARLAGLDAVAAIVDRAQPHRSLRTTDLEDDEPMLLLGVLNDVRLALGARLGIEQLDRDHLDPDDPAIPTLAVMDHLAWWQEQLLEILDPSSVERRDEGP